MSFRVEWDEAAVAELADIWLRAADRMVITRTVYEIDRILSHHADVWGEPRSATRRAAVLRPLWVYYQIDFTARTVLVLHTLAVPTQT